MKHLKLFFALFAMLALGVGNAWGAEASFTIKFKDNGTDASTALTANTFINQVAEGADLIKSVSTSNCYAGTGGLKCSSNKNNGTFTLTLNNSYTISKIVLSVKNKNATTKTVNVGNTSFSTSDSWNTTSFEDLAFTGTETTSDQITVSLAGTANSKRVAYIASMTVYYKTEDAGGDPEPVIVKTLKTIEVTDMTRTFEQGDVFKFDGTCTATYSVTKDGAAQADETAEVTPTSVSEPDMNQIGTQTVYVTYSEGGVEKTDDYEITITENTVTAGTYCTGKLGYTFWGLSAEKTTAAANEVDYTGMFNDITINIKNGAKTNAYFKEDHTRVYSGGYTMTFTAPVNYVITAISFTPDAGNNWAGTHTANVGTMTDSKNWTGSANEVTITFGGTCRITDICVTYEAAPVEPVKTLTSIEITTPATQTTFWQGETFNHKDLVVTAHYSDAADEVITPTVTGSTATAGTATVTVSYKEQSTSYAITVKAIPNTKETAYTVADAYDIIDKLTTAEGVFISGTISQVDSYSDEYKSITYWISADGTTTKQLQVYSGKGLESADFLDKTDLSVGDQVIVCGNLKKYSGTYEFDKNNYLASHTPTTKDPAGLAYATTSYTANVGEPFTTPELTNPHNLVVTYATSDASKATVDVNGAVTIVAAGEVTITASTTGDATHDAGSASYTITISNPGLAVATLPFYFNGKQADIEGTPGMTQSGIDSKDYADAPYLKMNTTGDWLVICFDSEPGKLSYDIKNNSFSGGNFSVQESADGETYTDVAVHTTITDLQSEEYELNSASRYVKFIYTTKSSGNVGLGNIKITKFGEEPEQPGEGGGETPGERLTEWVLTPLADITTNDLVVITMTKGETTWAMTNDKGTSAAPVASVVTLSADALAAEPDANLKWVVSNDNGTLTIYPYNTYETWLYCINNNNGVRVGDNEDNKLFTIDADYGYMYNVGQGRYLGVYNSQDWRCYTTMHDNIKDQTLAFYVKKNANDNLPSEDPEEPGEDPVVPTITPVVTFVFNTAEGLADLGIDYPTIKDNSSYKTNLGDNAKYTQDGITMTTTDGKTPTRAWLNGDELDLRVYKNATMTFSVPDEHKITAVVFDGEYINHLLVNGVAVSDKTWIGNAQEVTFTAKSDASTIKINTISFALEYIRPVTNGNYGTICLPYASSNYTGMELYEVSWLKAETGLYLDQLEADAQLVAGKPYIFRATDSKITVTYTGDAKAAPVEGENGLTGTFEDIAAGGVLVDNYIIAQNKIWEANDQNTLPAYRAYINKDDVPTTEQAKLPGRRRVCMGENAATGLDNITNGENTTIKVIENGQLIIIRNGEKFNAQGVKF